MPTLPANLSPSGLVVADRQGAEVAAGTFRECVPADNELLGFGDLELDPGSAAPATLVDRGLPLSDQRVALVRAAKVCRPGAYLRGAAVARSTQRWMPPKLTSCASRTNGPKEAARRSGRSPDGSDAQSADFSKRG